jgi:hypothetical protein
MWYLIFVVFINGVPQTPANLGTFTSESVCAQAAHKVASGLLIGQLRYDCIDNNANE